MKKISIAAVVIAAGLAAGGAGAGIAQAATAGNPQQQADKATCAEFKQWYENPNHRTGGEIGVTLADSRQASIWLLDDVAMWVNTHENLESWTVNVAFDCGLLGNQHGG